MISIKYYKKTQKVQKLIQIIELIEMTQVAIESNVNKRLALENLMINIPFKGESF